MMEPTTGSAFLADLVQARMEDILRRWELRVQALLSAEDVPRSELRDSLPRFLAALVDSLRSVQGPAAMHPLPKARASAREHGRQRFRLGFDIEAMVYEYGVLRDVLLELVEETGTAVSIAELRLLTGFIDEGIAEAVAQHARDAEPSEEGDGAGDAEAAQAARHARMQVERDVARERLRQVLTQVPLVLWAFDREGTVLVSEGHGLKAIGLESGQTVGRSIHAMYASREDLRDHIRRALAGESFSAEVQVGDVWFDSRFSPVFGPGGEVVGVMGLSLDISERRRSEAVLRQSETRYRLATLATSDVIWDWDLSAAVIHWSETLYKVFGYGPGEQDTDIDWWSERLHPEERERVVRKIHAAIEGTDTHWQDDYRFRRSNGTWAFVQDRGSLVRDAHGKAVRMVGAIADVSARVAAEAEARRRAEFEQRLIGIVSHDLRSPISAIITSAATLLKRQPMDERLGRAIGRILSSAERANRMLRDVLDFTQARLGGGIPVVPRPLDLHAFTRGVLDEMQLAWPERRLERVQRGDGQGEWDGDRLAQVLTNLVSNAFSYSPADSPVRVETRGEGDAVVLCVHNAGAPIASEQVPRLFEPMKRGGRQRSSGGQGLGLGLFIVKHLVDAHGGTLEVHSAPDNGTTFTVRLPRHPAPEREPPRE
jgi:PAS domain S-box-containing protein